MGARKRIITPLDVFALKYLETNWLGVTETLQDALDLAKQRGEGKYCVFSQKSHEKEYYEVSAAGAISPL